MNLLKEPSVMTSPLEIRSASTNFFAHFSIVCIADFRAAEWKTGAMSFRCFLCVSPTEVTSPSPTTTARTEYKPLYFGNASRLFKISPKYLESETRTTGSNRIEGPVKTIGRIMPVIVLNPKLQYVTNPQTLDSIRFIIIGNIL